MTKGPGRFAGCPALVLAVTAVLWQLMTLPVPGIADNGDFAKMLGRYGLRSGQQFDYAGTKYRFDSKFRWHSGYESSEGLVIEPAVAMARAFWRDGSFDLRIMGAVHAALFLLALWLFVRLDGGGWLGFAGVLVFCDFMYVGFLNSFYMDVAALLFTLLAAVFYLRAMRQMRPAAGAAALVCMLLAVLAGPHYAVLAPWFAVLAWVERDRLCDGRKLVAAGASLVLAVAAWVPYRYLVSPDYAGRNPFNIIFSQILPNADDPERTLAELGLDRSYRRFNQMTADWPEVDWNSAAFRKEFTSRTSYFAIMRFYARHPRQGWRALRLSLDVSGRFQSPLGNFDSAVGKPPGAHYETFRLLSRVKQRLFFQHGARLFGVFAALALAVPTLAVWKRRDLPRGAVGGSMVLAGAAESMMVASALADVFDQFRHQFVTFALFDMLLLALAALGLGAIRPAGAAASNRPGSEIGEIQHRSGFMARRGGSDNRP